MILNRWCDTCYVCNGTRFWTSKTGYKVCMSCTPSTMQALIILARRSGAAAVKQAESWVTDVGQFA